MNAKIGSPGYVYKPWTPERRKAASEAAKRRHGAQVGHRTLYGVQVDEAKFKHIAPIMYAAKQHGHSVETIQWSINLLVVLLTKAPDDQP
jgi:hypothetical protein